MFSLLNIPEHGTVIHFANAHECASMGAGTFQLVKEYVGNYGDEKMFVAMVGKPSAGKSTFFKSATLAEAETANYPFTTIKPNHAMGHVKVKDAAKEFDKVANPREGYIMGDYRFVPVDMMDIAGLVPGAHEGLGMGSQFLDDIRQADVLIHVIDISGSINEKGEPCGIGNYDPLNDVQFLEDELDYWYKGIMSKGWEKFTRTLKQTKEPVARAIEKQMSAFKVDEDMIKKGIKTLGLNDDYAVWTDEDLLGLARELRKATKPMVLACNKVDTGDVAKENFERMKAKFPHHLCLPCSAESEFALRQAQKAGMINYVPGDSDFTFVDESKLNDAQKNALNFIRDNVLKAFGSTGVQNALDAAVFDKLKYIAIHPAGSKLEDAKGNTLPDCFLMPPGTTALDFAYRLHTDFGDKFVKAQDVRTRMPKGKDEELKHLDMIEIFAQN